MFYPTGDISNGHDGRKRSGFETTPIFVDGMLYLTTPFNRVIALDPATGKERWAFDPKIDQRHQRIPEEPLGDALVAFALP
jgi:quinoprotein glucose dehydrogenase